MSNLRKQLKTERPAFFCVTNEKLFGAKHILLQQKGASNIEIKHYHENGLEARGAGLVTEVTFWASSSAHQ